MSDISDLLEDLDIESWLDYEGIRYKLTRGTRGIQANVRECPVCANTNWKVYVGTESGLGNCFVCETKFSKWKLIQSHVNLSNADTYRYIESYMGAQGFRSAPASTSPVTEKAALVIPDSMPLPINGRNLTYLEKRGVTVELSSYFDLRYCHSGKFHYKDAYGRPASQIYSGRVIIPIRDLDGNIVSFQGRDITGTSDKRYLFPPEFASTGSVLYNGQNAFKSSSVVIGEGVFDCIAIKAAMDSDPSFKDFCAVASFGKKLGEDQIAKLKRLKAEGSLKEVVFMWDSEKAALESAVAAAMKCRSYEIPSRIALLPSGKDPNEVDASVVRNAIRDSVSIDAKTGIKLRLAARNL